jgi:hypothetical protein
VYLPEALIDDLSADVTTILKPLVDMIWNAAGIDQSPNFLETESERRRYACPGPNALSPSFETRFGRMEHDGGGKFTISYMRHTEKWFRLFPNLTVDECLDGIEHDWHFQLD